MMNNEIQALIENIKADYALMSSGRDGVISEIRKNMIDKFNANIRVDEGRKYIKNLSQGSVWGFIVKNTDDKQFKQGDILKAASWAAPARNKARGNIIQGGYTIEWTGPRYLC
jgi:hypothetical protein